MSGHLDLPQALAFACAPRDVCIGPPRWNRARQSGRATGNDADVAQLLLWHSGARFVDGRADCRRHLAGDTLPAPEVTLRHSVTNPIFGTSGVRFVYDFDVDVTGVSAFLVQDPDLHPLTGTHPECPALDKHR